MCYKLGRDVHRDVERGERRADEIWRAIFGDKLIRFGMHSNLYSNVKILRYRYSTRTSRLSPVDFQPTNGDRANMLKNKNEDGSVKERQTRPR